MSFLHAMDKYGGRWLSLSVYLSVCLSVCLCCSPEKSLDICVWDLIRCSCTKICRQIADFLVINSNVPKDTESTGGHNKFSVGFIALCKTLVH
jgi:hypothetical protein